MKVKLLSHTINPELLVATSAKLCYSSSNIEELMNKQKDTDIETCINVLKNIGHQSPLEHVSFTFGIEDISRVTEVQLVRHRIASYSIKSGRYVKIDNFKYSIPPSIEIAPGLKEKYENKMMEDMKFYTEIVDKLIENTILEKHLKLYKNIYTKMHKTEKTEFIQKFKESNLAGYKMIEKKAIEDARYVLPQATRTNIIVTMNARSLLNFFEHRICNRAQWEIRTMAKLMLKEVKEIAPIIFSNIGSPCMKTGVCPEGKMQCSELKGKIPTN